MIKKWIRHIIFGHSATKIVLTGLKRDIKRKLNISPVSLLDAINTNALVIIEKNKHLVVDGASAGHVEFSSYVLASYIVLLEQFENNHQQTLDFIKSATLSAYDSWMLRLSFSLLFKTCRNRPEKLRSVFSWMMRQYGSTFSWQSERVGDKGECFSLSIDRCFYFEFFKANHAVFLTPILCQLDAIWFDLIDAKKHGFSFNRERYQTQGLGAAVCVFPIDKS